MITPVFNSNQYPNKIYSLIPKQKVVFGINPAYEKLSKFNVGASNYFRRSPYYGCQDIAFVDVIKAIQYIFSKVSKPKILITGVGKAQEPFSVLTVIKNMHNDKSLEAVVDLNCVDLQPQILMNKLDKYAYLDVGVFPKFAEDCFEYIQNPPYPKTTNYKIKPDILKYLEEVFNNPEKTKWDTKIQDFAAKCPDNMYDLIFFNNVLPYIFDLKDARITMENFSRILKSDSLLITDFYEEEYKDVFKVLDKFKIFAEGIWQKPVS